MSKVKPANRPKFNLFGQHGTNLLMAPEQLDRAVRVVGPQGWLALLTAILLLAAGFSWSILGVMRLTVSGEGLLLPVRVTSVAVTATKPGWLRQTMPIGSFVTTGQVIAVIDPAETIEQKRSAEAELAELTAQRAAAVALFQQRLAAEDLTAQQHHASLSHFAEVSRQELVTVEETLKHEQEYLARGLTTLSRVEGIRAQLYALRDSLARTERDLAETETAPLSLASQRDAELRALDQSIAATQGRIAGLSTAIGLAARIISPVDGLVVARFANEGQLVEANTRLLTVQAGDAGLQAVLFIPAEAGKKIKTGMTVRLAPSTAAPEEYGLIRGAVDWVSPVPPAEAEIAETLGQEDLARRFTRNGAPIEIHVRLLPDPASANGYAWTSARGQQILLSRGLLVEGWIVTRQERPISFVMPGLRRLMGIS